MNLLRLGITFLLIISLSVACRPQPIDCAQENVFCVGLVTAFGGIENHGLNQVAWETLQRLEAQAKMARLDKIESIDTRDWLKNVYFFAENEYDVVISVGRNLSETTVAVASEYPTILFIGIDQDLDEEYANIATINFAEEQAGFLAGVLAAKATETNIVGAVCETSGIDSVWQYCEGFRAGVTHENEDVLVRVTYREGGSLDETFNDPEWGEQSALSQLESGVDVLTGFGGNTSQAAFLAASEKGILVVGAEEDLYFLLPDIQPVLITSVINDPSAALSNLVLKASQGEIMVGPYPGQITYTSFRGPKQGLEIETEEVLQELRNGDFEINLPERK